MFPRFWIEMIITLMRLILLNRKGYYQMGYALRFYVVTTTPLRCSSN